MFQLIFRTSCPKHTYAALMGAFLLAVSGTAGPITIQPDAATARDATVYEGFPTGNLSGGDNASLPPSVRQVLGGFTGFLVVSQTTSGNDLQSLVSFSLDALAGVDSDHITDATLGVYTIDSTRLPFPTDKPKPTTPIDVSLYETGTTWDQTAVSWRSAPYTRDTNNVPISAALDTRTVDGTDTWIDFDVTASLKAALLTNNAVIAYALASPDSTTDPDSGQDVSLVAYAGESSTFLSAPLQPKLTVTLVPEPAAALLAVLGPVLATRRRPA